MYFLDTNILVYSRDCHATHKQLLATSLLDELSAVDEGVISTQVLSEFYWVTTRKLKSPLSHEQAVRAIEQFQRMFRVVALTTEVLNLALELVERHAMSLWDAQILAAASLSRATAVLTEDFQSQPVLCGLRYANPFELGFDWHLLPT